MEATASAWVFEAPESEAAQALAEACGLPTWLAGLLVRRGLRDPSAYEAWITPKLSSLGDPFDLPGMDDAVARILLAVERRERITVFGDYDVDGITSTALLAEVLQSTGLPVATFLPLRLEEGYGLSLDALARCIEETRPQLIITVDCGTSSVGAVKAARADGLDVIITDHHEVGDEIAPAVAVVNPRLSPEDKLHVLAGVGVTFKLVHALLKRAREQRPQPGWALLDPRELLDLVALGTVADLVPLLHENRIFVTHGLRQLNTTRRVGLKALASVAGIDKPIGTYEVGFLLGPRLNAAGRLDSARIALELLMTRDATVAHSHARVLDAANRERQGVERAIVDELLQRATERLALRDAYALVEADEGWHPGVVGIASTRLTQKFCRPSLVIGTDDRERWKGSGRSVPGFNLVEALAECREHLVKFGGHAMAAGIEIKRDQLDSFREKFEAVARRHLSGMPLIPRYALDGWIDPDEVSLEIMAQVEALGPFGMGFPEPLWAASNLVWDGAPREVGKGHLKGRLKQRGRGLDMIAFGQFRADLPQEPLEAVFQLRRESFRGRENIIMHVKEIRSAVSCVRK